MRNREIPSDREKVKNHHRTLSLSLRKREKLKKSSSNLKPQESGRSAGASGEGGGEGISFKINKCYHWTLRAEMRKRWKMRMSKLVVAAVNFPLLCTYSQFMLLSVVGVDGWMDGMGVTLQISPLGVWLSVCVYVSFMRRRRSITFALVRVGQYFPYFAKIAD